jgi:hypothetical protein
MNLLFVFYKRWLRSIAIGLVPLSVLISTSLPSSLWKIIGSSSIGLLFLGAEWLIRNKLWRLPFFYRKLDFEDEWRCVTFYQDIECRDQNLRNAFTPSHTYHEAKIYQDCRSISIGSCFGEKYNQWKSITMDLTDSGGVAYAYTVEYTDGSNAKGFEELSVMQRHPGKNGKPILLEGSFAHCAEGQPKALRGRVVFCSRDNVPKIIEQGKVVLQAFLLAPFRRRFLAS